jgi:hypothetical protein
MPASTDLRPLTKEQQDQLRDDLTLVEERLQDIAVLMRVCYGEDSQAAFRADEVNAALQRLNGSWKERSRRCRRLDKSGGFDALGLTKQVAYRNRVVVSPFPINANHPRQSRCGAQGRFQQSAYGKRH